MPSKETIRLELDKLTIAYPYPERGDAELDVLAQMWSEDLGGMPDHEFRERIREHRRSSKWFPTSADLLAIELSAPPENTRHQALPPTEGMVKEQAEKNKRQVGKILDMLKHKKAM